MRKFTSDDQASGYRKYIFSTWRTTYASAAFLLLLAYIINIIQVVTTDDSYRTKWAFHVIFISAILITLIKGCFFDSKDKSHALPSFLLELAIIICFIVGIIFDYIYCLNDAKDPNQLVCLVVQYIGITLVLALCFSWWFLVSAISIVFLIASIIASNALFNESIALFVLQIVIVATCVIVHQYNEEDKIKRSFENKNESMKTWKNIFYVLPEGILLVDQKKQLAFHNTAFLSILGLEEERKNLSFNRIFKDTEIKIIKSFQDFATGSMNSTKVISGQENLISKLSRPRNLNELHHLVWKNWDEVKLYFDKALGFDVTSSKNYLIFHAEVTLQNKEKRIIEIKFGMKTFSNKPTCIFLWSDITERGLATSPRESAEANTKFLATLSHELRTPVNRAINYIQAALDDKNTLLLQANNYLHPALSCAKFLMITINDLVDFSQLLSNTFRLVIVPKSIMVTIREAIKACEIQAKIKNIKIETKLPQDNWDAYIKTDHNRLLQTISNLISNAIKQTFAGRVIVSVNKEGLHYRVSVQDSSTSVDEQVKKLLNPGFEKANIFDNFLNLGGIGVGLYISNFLAKLLGPQSDPDHCGLHMDGNKTRGTTVYFFLEDRTSGKSTPEDVASLIPLEDKGDINLETEQEIHMTKFNDPTNPETHHLKISSHEINIEICDCTQILIIGDDSKHNEALAETLHSLRMITEPVFSVTNAISSIGNRLRYPCSETCQFFKAIFIDLDMLGGHEQIQILSTEMKKHDVKCPVVGVSSGIGKGEYLKNKMLDGIVLKPCTNSNVMNTLKHLGVY